MKIVASGFFYVKSFSYISSIIIKTSKTMNNYQDIKTIERNFEQQLPDVQITDIVEFNARQYDIYTTERKHGTNCYAVYIVDGYILDRATDDELKIN